jgi:hypothetical protein
MNKHIRSGIGASGGVGGSSKVITRQSISKSGQDKFNDWAIGGIFGRIFKGIIVIWEQQ